MVSLAAPARVDHSFHQVKPVYQSRSIERTIRENRLIKDDVDLIEEFFPLDQRQNEEGGFSFALRTAHP